MKIWISPYDDVGFLIKIQTKDFAAGYADCRPWPIFKDGSVKKHVDLLKNRKLNYLLRRSLFFAHIDGYAREVQHSLWEDDLSLRSHYTVFDLKDLESQDLLLDIREQGFQTLKLKVGRDLEKEIPLCLQLAKQEWFRFRLDFNGADAEPFLQKMNDQFLTQIDLIEDPGTYDAKKWQALEERFGVPMALDQASGAEPSALKLFAKVIKPARENIFARPQDIITNSLDHPVGQAFAALQAQESVNRIGEQTRDYGLQSSHLFAPNDYFAQMTSGTAYFGAIPGTGIGFDDLLAGEPWIAL